MLSVQLFGSPQISRAGLPLHVTRRKSRALVYYVAAHPQPVLRERLLNLLWHDLDRSAAQQTLRTTLHGLRKALGDALLVDDEVLALSPDCDVDVRHLARLPTNDDIPLLTAVLALYRGDFLQGFDTLDGPFDDWVAAERERYRLAAGRGFVRLARQHEEQQSYRAAIDAIEHALDLDSLQEDVQRDAMRLHYLAGDRVGAIRRYEQLRALLDEELAVPPMTETQKLYDAIITDTLPETRGGRDGEGDRGGKGDVGRRVGMSSTAPSPPHPLAPAPPPAFTGRDRELQTLREQATSGTLALIEGEPGIGKTRLAQAFLHRSDVLVLAGAAQELEHTLPYQPVIEALRGLLARPDWPMIRAGLDIAPVWLAEVARLLPELDGSAARMDERLIIGARPVADEARLWEGVSQFLRSIARARPLALLLDDVHWADASTLALLGYLVRHGNAPLTFVATTRTVAPRSSLAALVQSLTRAQRLVHVSLARLSDGDVAQMAQRVSPNDGAPFAAWLHQAEGNPYILAELIRHAREYGLLRSDGTFDQSKLPNAPVVPQTIYALIRSRFAQLSNEAQRVLDAAVTIGREFEFAVVAQAAALSEATVLDALDELRAAALVRPLDGLRYSFDHSLTLEVAEREMGEARHRLLHRRVAEALIHVYGSRADEVAGLIASHYVRGDSPQCAAAYAFRAGQRAARLSAWQEAVAFYEQALNGADDGQRADVLMALGDAYFYRGDAARAAETFRALVASAGDNAASRAQARLALGRTLLPQGRFAEIIALVQQVLADGPTEYAADAEFLWGTALSLEGADLDEAAAHVGRAETLLREQPHAHAISLSQTRFELGSIAAQQGNLQHAITFYREALAAENTADGRTLTWRILTLNNLAYHLHLAGDPSAMDYAREGMRLAQERGVTTLQTYLHSTLGEIALAAGDLNAAEREFSAGLALAERLHTPERIAGLTANLGLVALHRTQTALAIHRLSTALVLADTLGTQHLAAQIRIWLAPLLPPAEWHSVLTEARVIAESGGRKRLLAEIERLQSGQS